MNAGSEVAGVPTLALPPPLRLRAAHCPTLAPVVTRTLAPTQHPRQVELETRVREDFTIMKKACTRAFSWLEAPTSA